MKEAFQAISDALRQAGEREQELIERTINMERRFCEESTVELTEARDDKPAQIKGYAARYYNGRQGTQYTLGPGIVERIMPGAFDRAVAEGDDVRALFNHDPNLVLGRTKSGTLALSVDDKGLAYAAQPPDTVAGRDVLAVIRRGDVSGSSFGFRVENEKWRSEGKVEVREIHSVRLFDVSPVTFPAYDATSVEAKATGAGTESWRRRHAAWKEEQRAAVDTQIECALAVAKIRNSD